MKSPGVLDQLAFTLWITGLHAVVLVPAWALWEWAARRRRSAR